MDAVTGSKAVPDSWKAVEKIKHADLKSLCRQLTLKTRGRKDDLINCVCFALSISKSGNSEQMIRTTSPSALLIPISCGVEGGSTAAWLGNVELHAVAAIAISARPTSAPGFIIVLIDGMLLGSSGEGAKCPGTCAGCWNAPPLL